MKPYQFLALPDSNDRGLWNCKDSRGQRVAHGTMENMKALAESLDAEAAATLYAGPLTRYTIPGWYVTIDSDEAARLAGVANKRADDITVADGVTLIHNGSSISIWSDGKILAAITGGPKLRGISEDAEAIIHSLRASDSGDVHVAGGMLRLAEIARITNRASISCVGGSHYNEGTIEALSVEYTDGTTQTLYAASRGYYAGYSLQIYENSQDIEI